MYKFKREKYQKRDSCNKATLDGRTPLDFVEIMSGSGEDTQEWKAIEQTLRAAGGLDSEELQKKIVKNRNR